MQIQKLDHVNLRTAQLETMISWYNEVLGLRAGWRPDFPFPGAWLYAEDTAMIHLIGVDGDPGVGSDSPLRLEHFAMTATGADEFVARLEARGENYRRSEIAETHTAAFNLWDPDGKHIHVDFLMAE